MKKLKEFIVRSEEELKVFVREFVGNLTGREVICLKGELGAGKTTFVKMAVEEMGLKEGHQVRSPTFTLINEYPTERGRVFHADLYRVDELDFSEFTGEGLLFIEWPKDTDICDYLIEFLILEDDVRLIRVFRK